MKLNLRRRSVYIGTIVALVAMIAGFALASVGGITFAPGTGNQNSGTISPGNTIYATTVATLTLVPTDGLTAGCLSTIAYVGTTANIPVVGVTGSTCPATGEQYDELTFTGVSVPASALDTFWISVNGAAANPAFTVTGSGSAITGGTLNIFIDAGPTSAAPGITSITVTVSGT